MSTPDPLNSERLDGGLKDATKRAVQIANMELSFVNHSELNTAETHLLEYGVSQGFLACIEFLAREGHIEVDYS